MRLWCKWNKPTPASPKDSLHPRWYCVYGGIGKESPVINSFWKDEWLIPTQLGQLKAVLDEKWPESVNRKHIILHQDNARLFFDDQAKTVTACLESSDSSVVFTNHCTFKYPFILVFTKFSMEKISVPQKTREYTSNSFLFKKKKFWNDGIMKLPEENGRS